MIQKETIQFLKDLEKNNNRDWFKKNKSRHDQAFADVTSFAGELIDVLGKTTPALKNLAPKDCVFRIYRDVRFSKNKDPYKTHFGVVVNEGGKKSPSAGFYIHISPKGAFIAGGAWAPESSDLKKIRQEIDYNFKQFKKVISAKKFRDNFGEVTGDKLKTTPKGYDADNEAIEYLRFKSFIVEQPLSQRSITGKTLLKECESSYKAMLPMLDFLNVAMD